MDPFLLMQQHPISPIRDAKPNEEITLIQQKVAGVAKGHQHGLDYAGRHVTPHIDSQVGLKRGYNNRNEFHNRFLLHHYDSPSAEQIAKLESNLKAHADGGYGNLINFSRDHSPPKE